MKCLHCGKEHDGSYGSGKFCSLHCAKSRKVDKSQRSATMKTVWQSRSVEERNAISEKIKHGNTGKIRTAEQNEANRQRAIKRYSNLTDAEKIILADKQHGKVYIYKENFEKHILPEEVSTYVLDGWQIGRNPIGIAKFKKTFADKTKEETAESFNKLKSTILKNRNFNAIEDYYKERSKKVKETLKYKSFSRNRKSKIEYDNNYFDSNWEVLFYKWLTNNGISFEFHPNVKFSYTYLGEEHFYQPDFFVEGRYVEIKGDHFFENHNEHLKMICPWDSTKNDLYEAKHQCMIENNVLILTGEFIDKIT